MTQEEKAKAYDKAIEKIKYVMEHGVSPVLNKEDLQDIFPELAESEDERIRKELIKETKSSEVRLFETVTNEKFIAWLEKQGEQKPKWTEEDSLMIDSIIDTMKWLEGKGATNMKIDWLKSVKKRMEAQQ